VQSQVDCLGLWSYLDPTVPFMTDWNAEYWGSQNLRPCCMCYTVDYLCLGIKRGARITEKCVWLFFQPSCVVFMHLLIILTQSLKHITLFWNWQTLSHWCGEPWSCETGPVPFIPHHFWNGCNINRGKEEILDSYADGCEWLFHCTLLLKRPAKWQENIS
jgi:hypothetical protein